MLVCTWFFLVVNTHIQICVYRGYVLSQLLLWVYFKSSESWVMNTRVPVGFFEGSVLKLETQKDEYALIITYKNVVITLGTVSNNYTDLRLIFIINTLFQQS